MTTTLITGGNKGLGYESARRLLALGHTVYIGSRDAGRGEVAARELGCEYIPLDVTDDASVDRAFEQLTGTGLDVLVNNAAIAGGRVPPKDVTADDIRHVYETNVFGVVRVTHAGLPLLEKSSAPTIVNVASGLGSLGVVTDPDRMESQFPTVAYSSSKSAVVMLTVQYAKAFPGMRINVVDPGYTATDLNGNSGTQSVTEGTDAIVRLATIGPDGPTGGFFDRDGTVPW